MKRSSRESLVKGLNEIDKFIDELNLNTTVKGRATEIYRNAAQEEGVITGRGVESVAGGCVLLAARESNDIIDAEDIAAIASDHIAVKTLHRTTKALRNELDIGFVLEDPHKYIDPIGDELGASENDRGLAEEIINIALEDGVASGKKAGTIAGSAYYVVACLSRGDGEYRQHDVANAAGVSTVSIRNTYRDFANVAAEKLDDDFDPSKHRSTA